MGNRKRAGKKQTKVETTTKPEDPKIPLTKIKQKKRDFDERSNAESVNTGETRGKSKNRKKSKLQHEETVTSTTVVKQKRTLALDSNLYELKKTKTSDPTEEIDTHKKPDHAKKSKKRVKTKSKAINTEETHAPHASYNSVTFQLTNLIKMCLKEDEKTISITKLQKKVLKKYCQMKGVQENPKLVREFHHCLQTTAGVEVVDDMVKLLSC